MKISAEPHSVAGSSGASGASGARKAGSPTSAAALGGGAVAGRGPWLAVAGTTARQLRHGHSACSLTAAAARTSKEGFAPEEGEGIE